MKKDYFIVKYYKNIDQFCLEFTCGIYKDNAEKLLAKLQAKDPTGIYRIEEEERSNCWWNN